MAAIFAFKCRSCGEVHEGSPSFAFPAPDPYVSLSEEEKASMATLDSDICTITHDEGTDLFIRAVLEIPIHGATDPFLWGLWVSVSQKSFERYLETYNDPVEGDGFFGWVCVSFVILMGFHLSVRSKALRPTSPFQRRHALVPLALYGSGMVFQMVLGNPVEIRSIAPFAMGIPLLSAVAGFQRWRSPGTPQEATP